MGSVLVVEQNWQVVRRRPSKHNQQTDVTSPTPTRQHYQYYVLKQFNEKNCSCIFYMAVACYYSNNAFCVDAMGTIYINRH